MWDGDDIPMTKWLMEEGGKGLEEDGRRWGDMIIIIPVGNNQEDYKGIEKNAYGTIRKKAGIFKVDWSQDLQWSTVVGSSNGRQHFSIITK
jgi:hypothetical protein